MSNKKKRILLGTLMALLLLCGCVFLLFLNSRRDVRSIIVDDMRREYVIHLPPDYDGSTALPLVLIFHGGGGRAQNLPRFSGFDDVADREGFIAVYPNGYERSWADGRSVTNADRAAIDDVAFITALLDELESSYSVDSEQIYATGISNGGFFTQRLICDLDGRVRAGAVIAANLSVRLQANCELDAPTSILFINGTNDPLVPYEGGWVLNDRGEVLSTDESIAWYREANGCPDDPTSETVQDEIDDGTSVRTTVYSDCENGTEVRLISVEGGGHTWPGRAQYLPEENIGAVSEEFDATEAIWTFFAAQNAGK